MQQRYTFFEYLLVLCSISSAKGIFCYSGNVFFFVLFDNELIVSCFVADDKKVSEPIPKKCIFAA